MGQKAKKKVVIQCSLCSFHNMELQKVSHVPGALESVAMVASSMYLFYTMGQGKEVELSLNQGKPTCFYCDCPALMDAAFLTMDKVCSIIDDSLRVSAQLEQKVKDETRHIQ